MIENYFNKFDNEIAAKKFNNPTLSTKVETLNQLETLNNGQILTQKNNNTNEIEKEEDFRGLYLGEKKKF